MNIDFNQIKIIKAEKENEMHKKGIWVVYNQNIEFNLITTEPITYENHCKWWESVFEQEFIYIILYQSVLCGYIRLTKKRTRNKEKNEISIAISKKYHKSGLGTYAYSIFEKEMIKIGITEIIALTDIRNLGGQKFFEKNNFKKGYIKYIKKIKD